MPNKKKNPSDVTIRNARASLNRDVKLNDKILRLIRRLKGLERALKRKR